MSENKYVCWECGNDCPNPPESTCDKCLDAPEARIKELEEKLSLYEWRDIKDAPKDRLVLVDSTNIVNRRDGENVALATWFYYDGLACWRDDNNEMIEPQPRRYKLLTPPTQEGEE